MTEALPVWNCKFDRSTEPNPPEMNALTVGAKFSMSCKGDIPVNWGEGPLGVQFAKKEDTYTLHILKAEKLEANEAVMTVTGYKAGQHNPEYVRVVQGSTGFEVLKPAWEIKTVLKKDGQPQQPYPPFGPWNVAFPVWIIVSVAILLVVFGLIAFRFFRRHSQRNRMLAQLALHTTALSPIHQFYRDARQLRRRLNVVKEATEIKAAADDLNREFRLYVLREFQIPTLDWSDRAIVEDLRRRHRHIFEAAGDPLRKTLRELARMKAQSSVRLGDVEQLHRMSMDAAERIESAKEEKRGRR
jgi:hypothetical protein